MGALNTRVLQSGGYAYSVHWPGAFATPTDAVAMLLRAKCRGLILKAADGNATVSADGTLPWWQDFQALAPVAMDAGLDVVPWLCVYPGDGDPGAAWLTNLANAVKLTGAKYVVLEPPMTTWAQEPSAPTAVQAVMAAAQQAVPGVQFLLACWGNPAAAGASFPWAAWNAATVGVLPELYWSAYGTDFGGTPGGIWNNYWLWLEGQATKAATVIPTFDFPKAEAFAALALNEGAPTVAWWLLDDMTAADADTLAGLSYAATVQPVPQVTTAPKAAPDLAAADADLAAVESDLAKLKADLGA